MSIKKVGSLNPRWKGDDVGYSAAHRRVEAIRGTPQECEDCQRTDDTVRYEWANLNKDYKNVMDYKRLCSSCHKLFDNLRKNTKHE